jgi:hypothetical protein
MSRFYLKMEEESRLQNVVIFNINRMEFLDKDRTMDNVQKHTYLLTYLLTELSPS